jgi:hypothetical protein
MLVLVSRLQDRNGDVRHVLRQDPQIRTEVSSYLDDVLWLAQRPPSQPGRVHMAASRNHLLAAVRGGGKRRRRIGPRLRIVGAGATATLLFATAFTAQTATHGVPAPVQQIASTFGFDHVSAAAAATPSQSGERSPVQQSVTASPVGAITLEVAGPRWSN